MSINNSIALSTHQLSVGYPNRIILSDLNLALQKGKLTCILGPNGIGKTTLIKTLSGLQNALKGEVRIANQSIHSLSKLELAKHISLVLTEKYKSWNTTVRDLVALGRHPYTDWSGKLNESDEHIVSEAIRQTNLLFLEHQSIDTLSDGQLQKAMIARALAQDGDIIILDEPTAHLDLSNKIEILLLLRDLAASTNKAILVSTHELELSIALADIFWIFMCGDAPTLGIPEELLMNGSLNSLFQGKNYALDSKTGQFRVQLPQNPRITITGDSMLCQWTNQALMKNRSVLMLDTDIQINCNAHNNWTLTRNGISENFLSLHRLISSLQQINP